MIDPIRAEQDSSFHSAALSELSHCDLVCLHVPLTTTGPHATHHLVGQLFLSRLKNNCILLNAARGAVVDTVALKKWGHHLTWCFDVWEHEPRVDLDVLSRCVIATPHVAGYAIESKIRGTRMVYEAACSVFQWARKQNNIGDNAEPSVYFADDWRSKVLAVYDPLRDTQWMKSVLLTTADVAKAFDRLRRDYPVRHELQ